MNLDQVEKFSERLYGSIPFPPGTVDGAGRVSLGGLAYDAYGFVLPGTPPRQLVANDADDSEQGIPPAFLQRRDTPGAMQPEAQMVPSPPQVTDSDSQEDESEDGDPEREADRNDEDDQPHHHHRDGGEDSGEEGEEESEDDSEEDIDKKRD